MNWDKILQIMKALKPEINRARYYAEQVERHGSDASAQRGAEAQEKRDALLRELRAELAAEDV